MRATLSPGCAVLSWGGPSSCGAPAWVHRLQWLQVSGSVECGSVVVAHALNCSAARGIESSVWAGAFLTVGPPGKSEMVSIGNQGWPAGPGELSLLAQVDSCAPGKPGLPFFCWCPAGSVT